MLAKTFYAVVLAAACAVQAAPMAEQDAAVSGHNLKARYIYTQRVGEGNGQQKQRDLSNIVDPDVELV
ncbi:hypothetical protein CTA1_11296 [Colletotrichum tanaceti]|uniref:Uncharacterized protein n=1 Tax=Colletotrichum tanaceti TaxID=1306861 RepID=A0A4U6XMF6_9PEZI|nr:hypothetical protein CTA1_11296 [Colletotrichum tanaceti]